MDQRLAARGLAVLLSTHDPDHAFSIAKPRGAVVGGRLIAQGAPAEVLMFERRERPPQPAGGSPAHAALWRFASSA